MKSIQRPTPDHRDCETVHDLIPAYSLGVTDAGETRLVEAHLKNCPKALAELKDYQELADKLLYSIPLLQAPAHLGDQLMAEIAQRSRRQDALPDVNLTRQETFRPQLKRSFGMKARSYTFAALTLILLLASNLYWFYQMAAVQQTQAQMNALLQGHNAVLALIGAGKTQRIELQNVRESAGRAVLLCNPNEDVGFVYAEDFPALTSNDVYQVWLVREDQRRMNAGVFQTNDEGEGTLIFQFSEPLRNFDAVEITREHSPGSLQPSSALLMQGAIVY
jgi:anti-sigma-K factor RskA/putative zinc finger protein